MDKSLTTVMGGFSIKRTKEVARWTLRMEAKNLLSFACGISFAFFVPMIGWLYPYMKGYSGFDESELAQLLLTCCMVYLIILMVCGSFIFMNKKTKEQWLALKMLPATDGEKFAFHILLATVGFAVLGLVGFCVADVLRMVVSLVAGIDVVRCFIPDFFSFFITGYTTAGETVGGVGYDYDTSQYAFAVCFIAFVHSFYVFGAVFFRRYQFALTSVALVLLYFLFVNVSIGLRHFGIGITPKGSDLQFYVVAALFGTFALLDYWLSFRLFKRMQVINNKLFNL